MNKTRKQHYVPRTYLRGWTNENKIFCLRENVVFPVAIENIAQQRDYYRLKPITEEGLMLIQHFIKDIPESFNTQFKEIINMLSNIPPTFEAIKKVSNNESVTELADIIINDTVEKLHSQIEGAATQYLEEIRTGSIEFWKDENLFLDFLVFISFQYTRTPKQENNAKNSMDENYKSCWGILSIIIALVLAGRINSEYEDWTLTLFTNNTKLPFITGDQPVINLAHIIGDEVKKMHIYMPISHKYAISLVKENKKNIVEYITISEEQQIQYYNLRIKEFSQDMIFSDDKDVLDNFIVT